MVNYTIAVASNLFDRTINFFGNWKRFRSQIGADDTDGFDPSGLIILQKGDSASVSCLNHYRGNFYSCDLPYGRPFAASIGCNSLNSSVTQSGHGWKKDARLKRMLSLWQGILTAIMLSPV